MPRRPTNSGSSDSAISPKRRKPTSDEPRLGRRRVALAEVWMGRVHNRIFNESSNPALLTDLNVEGVPLVPTQLNLFVEENRVAHRTDEYEHENLIVRRGQAFKISIKFDRFIKDDDDVVLQFMTGEMPLQSKGTLIRLPIQRVSTPDPEVWHAVLKDVSGDGITVEVTPSAEAIVGKYSMFVATNPKEEEEYRHDFNDPIYVLFNPWCKGDQVFLDDEACRQEYVLNDTGRIWVGSSRNNEGIPWYFGQFEDVVLEATLHLLDKADLADAARSNPISIVRTISGMANSNDSDGGILTGRWTETYPKDSTEPTAWSGSYRIIAQYMATKKAVRYGQCWVFSGVVTALLRSLGIPTRSVTNFESAHDTDCSMTIDFHYDTDGSSKDELNDSIWNFHVWNESWFKRPDLPEGYGGWQAHDATPQEESEGKMQCGPASIKAIKEGHVYLGYDTPFIFAEVNGDKCYWEMDKKGELSIMYIDESAIGYAIKTKAVGSEAEDNITGIYKYPEGSEKERCAVRCVNKYSKIRNRNIYKFPEEEVSFTLNVPDDAELGQGFVVSVSLKNKKNEARAVTLNLSTIVSFYTGVPSEKIKKQVFEETLQGGEEKEVLLEIDENDYREVIKPEACIAVYANGKVIGSKQKFATVQKFSLKKPTLKMTLPREVKSGAEFEVTLKFTNPLKRNLTNARFTVDSRGIVGSSLTEYKKPIAPGEEVVHTVQLVAGRRGRRQVVANFTSLQLTGLHGVGETNIVR